MEADRSLGVSWGVKNLGGKSIEPDREAVSKVGVRWRHLRGGSANPSRLLIHHLEERQVILIQQDRRTGEAFEADCAANVIDMSMGNEDLLQFEAKCSETPMDANDVIAGVDNDRFTGFFVTEQGAVALQGADGEGL